MKSLVESIISSNEVNISASNSSVIRNLLDGRYGRFSMLEFSFNEFLRNNNLTLSNTQVDKLAHKLVKNIPGVSKYYFGGPVQSLGKQIKNNPLYAAQTPQGYISYFLYIDYCTASRRSLTITENILYIYSDHILVLECKEMADTLKVLDEMFRKYSYENDVDADWILGKVRRYDIKDSIKMIV